MTVKLSPQRLFHPPVGPQGGAGILPGAPHPMQPPDGFQTAGEPALVLDPQPGLGQLASIDLASPEGKAVIESSLAYLKGFEGKLGDFVPHSIDRDSIGMVHARFNRTFEDRPVYGEQVITHLKNGKVESHNGNFDPIELTDAKPADMKAIEQAARDFAGEELKKKVPPEQLPMVMAQLEAVPVRMAPIIFRGQDGAYHRGYYAVVQPVAQMLIDEVSAKAEW